MSVTLQTDKRAIKSIIDTDPYIVKYLGFDPGEVYCVKATNELLGLTDTKNQLKQQIFIYNATPEATINPQIHGIVYEIDVSVPQNMNGNADLAMEQILALLDNREISRTHRLEILDMPTVLSSETSLYQVGIRFVCYVSKFNQIKIYNESED